MDAVDGLGQPLREITFLLHAPETKSTRGRRGGQHFLFVRFFLKLS